MATSPLAAQRLWHPHLPQLAVEVALIDAAPYRHAVFDHQRQLLQPKLHPFKEARGALEATS